MAYVIKSNDVPEAEASPSTPYAWVDFGARAREVLAQATAKAEAILRQAQDEAAAIREKARAEGLAAGRRQAQEEARKWAASHFQDLLAALDQFRSQLTQLRSTIQQSWETQLVGLAVGIAERIVRRELAHAPDITADWIREALELARLQGAIQLHLHPSDHEKLAAHLPAFRERLGDACRLDVIPDSAIDPGGCLVATPAGRLDYQLPAQLDRMFEELAGERPSPSSDTD